MRWIGSIFIIALSVSVPAAAQNNMPLYLSCVSGDSTEVYKIDQMEFRRLRSADPVRWDRNLCRDQLRYCQFTGGRLLSAETDGGNNAYSIGLAPPYDYQSNARNQAPARTCTAIPEPGTAAPATP